MIKQIPIRPIPHLIHQPDGYSCGATAAKMMLDMYNPSNDLSIEDIKELFLTNPETGTTHEGMINGLGELNIPYTRTFQSEAPFEELDNALEANKLFLMRTAIYGCKHWLLVYGKSSDGYHIADPMGRYWTAPPSRIEEIWGCREWDGFIVEHSFDSEMVEIRKAEQNEVEESLYIGYESFVDKIGGSYKGFYNSVMWAMNSLNNVYVAVYRGHIIGGYFLEYNNISDYYFDNKEESYKGKVGVQGVALFLLPEFRGQGIGKELRAIPLAMNADYVWGMHLNVLNNVDNWVKFGRRKVSGGLGMAVTLMDLEPSSSLSQK